VSFVVTAGQLKAVQAPATAWAGVATAPYLQLSPTLSMTYEQLWRAQPAIRTVVGFLARNVAQLGVDPYRRISATDREKAGDHPLARLLERPLPNSKWTKYRLMNTLMSDLCVFDDAYWLKLRADGDVKAVVPVPPRFITPIGDNWFAPDGYRITGNRGYRDVDAENVVHFHGYNPEDPRRGVPPIETLRQILAEEHAASIYREQMWRNGARVAGYIKRPKDAPRWSEGARDRFRNDWQAQYAGDGPQTGGTPVLEDGMEFSASGVTPKDAQYVEARKLTREEVAVAYHISPTMLGLMEGATFANITEQHKMLYQDTLAPWLAQISQDIECQLLEDIDPGAVGGSVYVEFNLADKLRGSFEQQAAAMSTAVGGPWMTRDEARAMYNLPHVEGADELIVPLNVIAGGLASPRDTAPINPDNGPSNGQPPKATAIIRRSRQRQLNVALSRAGARHYERASTAADLLDLARWERELSTDLAAAGVGMEPRLVADLCGEFWADIDTALTAADPRAALRQLLAEETTR
jgi:HK97 family phage portal protein